MKKSLRIVLIGDYSPEVPAHKAIPRALELAAMDLTCTFEIIWQATDGPALRSSEPACLA